MFYIASLKHTHNHHEHITWWGPNWCGYTPVVGDNIGEYELEEALKLNDAQSFIAVPVDVVKGLLSPEPYWKPGARFYDQRGPVVDNTRKNWNSLISNCLDSEMIKSLRPKPEPFKGKRRSFGASA